MNINTDIYGAPESWVSFSTATDKADLKTPVWGTSSYKYQWYGGFLTGIFTLNEDTIDRSIAPWGINSQAAINNKKYLYVTLKTSGGSFVDLPEPQTRNVYSDNSKPLPAIFAISQLNQYAINQYDQYAYNADQLRTNGKLSRPITNFTYNNIVICPQIVCGKVNAAQNAGYDVFTCSIRDYFDNYINTYPVIIRIYVDGNSIYYGQPTVNVSSRVLESSNALGHVDTRTSAVYPVSYNDVVSPLRQAMKAVTNNRITIVGMDNGTTPPTLQCPNSGNLDLSDDDTALAYVSIYNTFTYYYADNGKIAPKNHITTGVNNYLTTVWEDPTEEEVLKECAYLGFWFATSSTTALNSAGGTLCTDDNLYLPKFDDAGITTGEYYHGADAGAHAPADDVNIRDLQPNYDPNSGGGEDTDQDTGDLDNQQLHSLRYSGSNNYYLLTESELSQFIGFINGLYTGESDPDKKRSIDFMGSNPTDYIVGIYGTGIELVPGATTSIKLGAVDTAEAGIYGRAVPTTLTYVNFGDYDIPAYGNFLDFKPYTTIEVYVPLCGTIEVDPGEYIGHNLKVDGLIDYQTGELTARIVRDGKTVTNTLTGSMWVQLPVTAAKMGDYQNNQHQLRMQMLQSVLSFGQSSANAINSDAQSAVGAIAGSAAGGSPTAISPGNAQFTIPQNAANTALALYNTHYQLTHSQPARATASSASAGNALEMYHHAMIFIKRPTFLDGFDRATYAHTIGHACCKTGKLSSFRGFTQCASAVLDNVRTRNGRAATEQEQQILRRALLNGIYL